MLFMNLFPSLLPSTWAIVLVGSIGLTAAGVAVMFGRAFLLKKTALGASAGSDASAESPEMKVDYDPFKTGSTTERRICLRREGNPVEVILGDASGESSVGRAWVFDRSIGGLGLLSDAPIEAGQILTVKPAAVSGPVFWLQIEVRSCRPNDGKFEVGCRFLKTPTWNQLLYYG